MGETPSRFEGLFLPHWEAAYNLARWIVHEDQDAQDVVQEAYVRAFKSFSAFRGGNPRAWLLTIVRNTAYTWMKRHWKEQNLIPFNEAIHPQAPLESGASEAVQAARKERLEAALNRLPVEFREVLVLYEVERWSYREMASALGVPVGTVMSRLARARAQIKAYLDGERTPLRRIK